MNIFRKSQKGFTLIELLVVIAIIGILSSVVLASLNTARTRARVAQAQGSLSGVLPGAVICMDQTASPALVDPTDWQGGNEICNPAISTNWPSLPNSTWTWSAVVNGPGAGEFTYSASGDGQTVTCTNTGCVTAPTP